MQKFAVIGLDTEKERLINQLMDFGAVELSDQTDKLAEEVWAEAVVSDETPETVSELEGKINRAEQALEVIEKYGNLKNPLFKTRRRINKSRLEQIQLDEESSAGSVDFILGLYDRINQLTDNYNKLETDAVSLSPWTSYDLPLELEHTRTTSVYMGVMPVDIDTSAVAASLEDAGSVLFKVVSSDKDLHYTAVIVSDDCQEDVLAILKQNGFSQVTFRGFEGTAEANLERIRIEKEEIEGNIASVIAEVAAYSSLKESIEEHADMLRIRLDKEKVRSRLLKTKKTFFIEGWVPARVTEKAAAILEENGCYYRFRDPEEGEDVPVLMENKNFFVPFESITEMYSLPDYRGFDPTSIFAIFYGIFFGIMLSDAGYGILMAVACFIVLKKYDLEGGAYKLIKLFFWCGISTTFWGAMFGGWFGDFFQVFAKVAFGKELVIEPIWFNPINDPMKLLIFSLGLGIVHIFLGMGIKAYMLIRNGKWFDAICDVGFWYLLIIGLIAWLGGGMILPGSPIGEIGKWMSIAGAAGLLLTGGRNNKGIGKITGGLGALYNITSYLSDILSYSRLLALGLATGVIAQVVNTMGSLFGDGIVGAVILLLIFFVGHTLNFAINALGSYVHSCRLQYIEFFGKFYEDGGEAFKPFRADTKYIKLED